MADFRLEIVEQHWLAPTPNGRYEDGSVDACSHGTIRCEIGGVEVATADPDYGIFQSAVQLLRTLEHDRKDGVTENVGDSPFEEGLLLCHSCGYPLGFGCTNFGTNWDLCHESDFAIISNIDTIGRGIPKDLEVRIPLATYRREIASFAREARTFYWSDGPRTPEDWELEFHNSLWFEFDSRLKRAEGAIAADNAPVSAG
jgi:hypothetical protein